MAKLVIIEHAAWSDPAIFKRQVESEGIYGNFFILIIYLLIFSNFRYIKIDKQIFKIDKANIQKYDEENVDGLFELVRSLDTKEYSNEQKKDDPDGLVALVKEVIVFNIKELHLDDK